MAKRAKRLIVVRFRESRDMWEVDYRDARGMRHRPLFGSEAEALAEAATLRKDLEQGVQLLDDPDLTVRGYVARWLAGSLARRWSSRPRRARAIASCSKAMCCRFWVT